MDPFHNRILFQVKITGNIVVLLSTLVQVLDTIHVIPIVQSRTLPHGPIRRSPNLSAGRG